MSQPSSKEQDEQLYKNEHEEERKIEGIIDNLTEEQIATAKVIEERLQQGLKNIDADLLDYIQKLPTITSTSTSTTNGEPNWKTLPNRRLFKLLETHKLLDPEEEDIPAREKMLSMLSTIMGTPPTLDPLFKAQRAFKENIKRLNSIVKKLLLVMEQIPEPAQTDTLRKAIVDAKKLKTYSDEEKFYIMVFGELKAGKSTCLNFLLGEDVLPSEDAACTVVVTELHYGETKKLKTVDSKTGEVCEQPLDLSKGKASDILANFLKEKNPLRNNTVFSKIILEWPSPILKAGIVFVDTPGLSENSYLEDMVDKYMKQVVGALLILNSTADGGHVRPSLAKRLAILDATDGLEVAFICNRIDQVDDAAKILSLYQDNLRTHFPRRFRTELVVPFNAKGALQCRQEGLQTAEQTEFVNKVVHYMETSFRSRLRILFDCVLSYTQVNQPIVPCFKFDLQSMSTAFSMSYQNREKTAKMLTELMERQQHILSSLEVKAKEALHRAITSAEELYTANIERIHDVFLEFAVEQIDILETDQDRHNILINRLLDLFSSIVNKMHGIKEASIKKIWDILSTHANQARAVLNEMQQFCLRKWTAKLLQMWQEAGDKARSELLVACLNVPIDHVSVKLSQSTPVIASALRRPSLAALMVWHILNTDSWRRDTAQAWIDNDLYKTQIPGIMSAIRKESETQMKELAKNIEERLAHVREFIANINRKSVFHTMELCQTLLKHTTIIEEEAAIFSFDTVKHHLADVKISGKLTGTNVWYGKWGLIDVTLKNLNGADASYYSRFLEQEADYKELDHPNIIKYFGTALVEDISSIVPSSNNNNLPITNRFLVTEFVPVSLNQCIHDLDAEASASILLRIALGAEYIHTKKKLMHFDFRPENIMLSADMSPKISDLNLCAGNLLSKDHCQTKNMGFIAPELRNGSSCTVAVDIFAFGSLIRCVYGNLKMPAYMTELTERCGKSPSSRPQWPLIRESILQKKVPEEEDDPLINDLVSAFIDSVEGVVHALLQARQLDGDKGTSGIITKDRIK